MHGNTENTWDLDRARVQTPKIHASMHISPSVYRGLTSLLNLIQFYVRVACQVFHQNLRRLRDVLAAHLHPRPTKLIMPSWNHRQPLLGNHHPNLRPKISNSNYPRLLAHPDYHPLLTTKSLLLRQKNPPWRGGRPLTRSLPCPFLANLGPPQAKRNQTLRPKILKHYQLNMRRRFPVKMK